MVKKTASLPKKKVGGVGRKPGGDPPAEFRFAKGVSGNSNGRPRGSKNLKTLVLEAAADQVAATVNGKSRKISKLQATVMQLATKAANGDHKTMSKFLELVDDMESRASSSRPAQFPFGEPDLKVLHEIYQRMKQCSPEES
jgi:hypothetical protein